MRRRPANAMLLLALGAAACAGSSPAPETPPVAQAASAADGGGAPPSSATRATAPVVVSVENARVALGDDIVFHVTLANLRQRSAALDVPRIDRRSVTFGVRRADGTQVRVERVHGALDGRGGVVPDVPETKELGPGESFTTDVAVVAVEAGRFAFTLTIAPSRSAAAQTIDAGEVEVVAADPATPRLGVRFETTHGAYTALLRPDVAFNTVESFASLVRRGVYDGTRFHRIVEGFMAQGGDPTGTGAGGPGYYLALEASLALRHRRGILSMARTAAPDTAGSQFFLMFATNASLDPEPGVAGREGYTIFGEMADGEDTLRRLEAVRVGPSAQGELSAPKEKVEIRSARLVNLP